MNEKMIDNIFYFCSIIEYISRKTKNHRKDVIKKFSASDIARQLSLAEVNHCLSFEQVSDELIEEFHIENGDYDTVSECKYDVPSAQAIGRVYQTLITSISDDNNVEENIIKVFSSFISDEISDFNSSVYYRNPMYLKASFQSGRLLA